jgi:excisionase family DNA binding protein
MRRRGAVMRIIESDASVNEKLLSVKEAASQLGVSKSWVYQSDVPYVKLGRRRLYRPSDLVRYVRARMSHRISSEAL